MLIAYTLCICHGMILICPYAVRYGTVRYSMYRSYSVVCTVCTYSMYSMYESMYVPSPKSLVPSVHPYASVCIHMHPPPIPMHSYASIRFHNVLKRQYSRHVSRKCQKEAKHRKTVIAIGSVIGANPTQHSKSAQYMQKHK